jgi:hypothetical protein
MRLPPRVSSALSMYKCHKHVTHAKISYFYVEFNLVECCLDLEAFRILVHGLCVTPQHPIVNPATSGLDSFVCVGGVSQPGGRGLSR